ncbi:hypothetical protein [Stutzerimonas stutzeri]|uniref:DUF2384 domain-containing protein n=1 Tax=Stutzerimonas stutzeri TaxID=316 RepID=A0A172WQL1_STUST|nr:hypothetical protein [Stutzerimonas stutzeri]ANF25778.1 hypothetical protein PS273GM_11780 [Stutzerimonas stutzeri]
MTEAPNFRDDCETAGKNVTEPEARTHDSLRATADAEEASMLARAKKAVLQSGDWLSATEVYALSAINVGVADSECETWKDEGRIFAIRYDCTTFFPSYALDVDAGYLPYPIIASVLQAFGAKRSGWELAYWFASVNSFLGGLRPQDLIASAPERVLAAAHNELAGIMHG